MSSTVPIEPVDGADDALRDALAAVMAPMAELCLGSGLSFGVVEELLKRAFVDAARQRLASGAGARDVSRVSAATGLTRREVTRISNDVQARAAVRKSPATQIFTRWLGSRRLRDKDGQPKPLKRQGRAPSFEALAQSVTRDVHPRTLLEELCRLGLARHDTETDTVNLIRHAFVPSRNRERMFGFLGGNVGDHFSASVANVLSNSTPPHLEQAVFADELSAESLPAVRKAVEEQWKSLLLAITPTLEALIEADAKAGRTPDRRVRIGLYSFSAMTDSPDDGSEE